MNHFCHYNHQPSWSVFYWMPVTLSVPHFSASTEILICSSGGPYPICFAFTRKGSLSVYTVTTLFTAIFTFLTWSNFVRKTSEKVLACLLDLIEWVREAVFTELWTRSIAICVRNRIGMNQYQIDQFFFFCKTKWYKEPKVSHTMFKWHIN